jgi:hypothetical protein
MIRFLIDVRSTCTDLALRIEFLFLRFSRLFSRRMVLCWLSKIVTHVPSTESFHMLLSSSEVVFGTQIYRIDMSLLHPKE